MWSYSLIGNVILCEKSFIDLFNGDGVTYVSSQDLFGFEDDVFLPGFVDFKCYCIVCNDPIQMLKE